MKEPSTNAPGIFHRLCVARTVSFVDRRHLQGATLDRFIVDAQSTPPSSWALHWVRDSGLALGYAYIYPDKART